MLLLSVLLLGCISQPIRPAQPDVANRYVSDVGPTASALSETQSRSYWSAASPFAITAWKYSGNTVQLVMKNTDSGKITLNSMYLDGALAYSSDTLFNPGESRTITGTMVSACGSPGSGFTIDDVRFAYTKGSVTGLEQKGNKPIAGKCS